MEFLLDTNICIYISKYHPLEVIKRFERLQVGEAAMSLITYGELRYGAERSQYRDKALQKLARLIELLPVLSLDVSVAEHYSRIRATLVKAGTPIGGNDLWIAAYALALDLTLVSNNLKEFQRVAGLKLENWVATEG